MRFVRIVIGAAVVTACASAQSLSPELKTKVDAKIRQLQPLSTDPTVVNAVKAYNAAPPPESVAMNNEKWKAASLLDPFVRSLTKNPLAVFLKSKKDDQISECFVSGANGTKVAFLAKTTSWSHKDKDKHKVPMSGRTWIGSIEVDESSGLQQVQVGLPVLDGGKPVGSIVVGLSIARLK